MSLTITSSLLQIYFQYNFNSSEFFLGLTFIAIHFKLLVSLVYI